MTDNYQIFLEAQLTPTNAEKTGKEWDVTIIGANAPGDLVAVEGAQYVRSKNGRLYSVDAIKESTAQWDGVKVYDNHLTQEEFTAKQGMRSPVKEWLGTIVNPYWDDKSKQLRGTFKVVEDNLAGKLKNAWEQGVLSSIGLSIDTFPITGREAVVEGSRMPVIEGFKKILSVDLVGDPAAGGGFNRIIAAVTNNPQEEYQMDKEQVQAMIDAAISGKVAEALADALAAEAEAMDAEELDGENEQEAKGEIPPQLVKYIKKKKAKKGRPVDEEDPAMMEAEEEDEDDDHAAEALYQVRQLESKIALRDALAAAKLPEEYAAPIQRAFEGRIFEQEELEAVIDEQKKLQAAHDATGRATESGSPRISAGMSQDEKLEVALMQHVFGVGAVRDLLQSDDREVKDRMSESLKSWQDDGAITIGTFDRASEIVRAFFGGNNPLLDDFRFAEASTLSSAIKNTVNIMVAADYSQRERWFDPIVKTEEVSTIDDATLVREYGVQTLDVVEAGAAYTEMALDDDEETATFVKKGNFIAVTLEDLMKDKVQAYRRIPRLLSDAWYNTLSDLVANVFTVNTAAGPVLSDTGALFNATSATTAGGHANLLTTALSFTSYSAARTAMRKQTDRNLGVGRKLQIEPRFLLVPEDLETTALQIRNSQQLPGSANNDINPFYNKFDVVVVPSWTDANNWALVGDPRRHAAIYLIFPRGNRVPSIFTADSEVAGSMFTNDTLRYKVRMMTYRFSSTYDCAPVADFRPLHASVVA